MGQPSVLSPLGALLAEMRDGPHLGQLASGGSGPSAAAFNSDPGTESSPGSRNSGEPAPLCSPFGALLTEIRDEQRHRRFTSGERIPLGVRPRRGRLEPDLSLETRVLSQPPRGLSAKPWLFPASLGLHAAFVAGAVILPLFRPDALPELAAGARVFFMEPAALTPPPPPPPPPVPHRAHVPRATATPPPTDPRKLTVPLEVPEKIAPEEVLDFGVEGGVLGGVEGGIPGGVVGGIVGGISEPPPPPKPIRITGQIKEPTKLKHVAPVYPEIAIRTNLSGSVVLECLISPQGRVVEVKVLRGIPLLNDAAIAAVRQWTYTPTLLDGVPVPVIMPVTVQFTLQDRPATTR